MVVVFGGQAKFHEVHNAILFTELGDEAYCVDQEDFWISYWKNTMGRKCPSQADRYQLTRSALGVPLGTGTRR